MVSPSATPPTLISADALQDGTGPELPRPRPRPENSFSRMAGLMTSVILATLWIGGAVGYFWGILAASRFAPIDIPTAAIWGAVTLVPPVFFLIVAWALTRGQAMARAAETLVDVTDRLFTADETASRTAARLGRAVRRELDGLNAGLDGAYTRMRALESVLENQIAALDEAGARVDVRGEALASRLTQERERIEGVATTLTDAATRAGETVAGRAAQLKSMIETAETSLKTAGQGLDAQVATFHAAANTAAEAPHTAALELDKQAKRIESVADAALSRAEFVLGRQERHRAAMNELMGRLKEDSTAFETLLSAQKTTLEQTIAAFAAETQKFDAMAGEAERQFEVAVANASMRTSQLAQSFAKEAERLKTIGDATTDTMTKLVSALQEAGISAQTLIGETSGQAKADAKALVGEAMAECDRLVRAARQLSAESNEVRESLSRTAEEVTTHLGKLPAIAKEEALRVRQMVKSETDEILDLSARTLSTIHARTTARPTPREPRAEEPVEAEDGLRGFARKLAAPAAKKKGKEGEGKTWQMSALLAAAGEDRAAPRKELRPDTAATLGALQAALSDLAIDLDVAAPAIEVEGDDWRRYLTGDRAVFVRKIASDIDPEAKNRIRQYYVENARFRDATDAYLEEFSALLARARESDGSSGGLLTTTFLTADTGKVYRVLAGALER